MRGEKVWGKVLVKGSWPGAGNTDWGGSWLQADIAMVRSQAGLIRIPVLPLLAVWPWACHSTFFVPLHSQLKIRDKGVPWWCRG